VGGVPGRVGTRPTAPRGSGRPVQPIDRRDALVLATLVAGLFLIYVVVQRAALASYDGKMLVSVSRNIVERGSLETSGDFLGFNTPYSSYGIGFSLFLVPFMAIQLAIEPNGAQWLTLANPVLLAGSGGLLWLVGRELGWRPWVSTATGFGFGVLTMALWQSTELYSEPGVTCCTVGALLGALRWQRGARGGPLVVGVAVGGAMVFRTDSAALVGLVALCVPLFVSPRLLVRRPTELLTLAAPLAVALAWVLFYNDYRFGGPLEYGYEGSRFTTPIGDGLRLLVVQGGKGFFHYNPWLLTALPGLVWLVRRNHAVAITVALLVVVRFAFYARWVSPEGGVAWGPRLLMPSCALLAVPAGEVLERLAGLRVAVRALVASAVITLAVAGAVVNLASVWVPYENQWLIVTRPQPDDEPDDPFLRARSYLETWSDGHILANLRMLDDSIGFPLYHWRGSASPIGVAALAGAVTCVIAAFVGSRARQPRPARDVGANVVSGSVDTLAVRTARQPGRSSE
jgi:hypothetical protein